MIKKTCDLYCPDFGYCNNRCSGKECEGFIPMDSDEEEDDAEEERLERMMY